jgi:hypothetical protein
MDPTPYHAIAHQQEPKGGGMKDELISSDAIALGEWVRKKEIEPTELLEVTIHTFWRHLAHDFIF